MNQTSGIISQKPFSAGGHFNGGGRVNTFSKSAKVEDTPLTIRVANYTDRVYIHFTKQGTNNKTYYMPLQEKEWRDLLANAGFIDKTTDECKEHIRHLYGEVGIGLPNGGEEVTVLPKSKYSTKMEKNILKKAKRMKQIEKELNKREQDDSVGGGSSASEDEETSGEYSENESDDNEGMQGETAKAPKRSKSGKMKTTNKKAKRV